MLIVALCAGWFYRYIVTGGLIARRDAPAFETYIAGRLVSLSIPDSARSSKNPLDASALDATLNSGRDLYQQYCQVCHGYDGNGATATGGGLYPRPPNLRAASIVLGTDGAIFYIVRNGIRNTGMPGFALTDQQTWQIVTYVRNLPITVQTASAKSIPSTAPASARYVGFSRVRNVSQ